MDDKGASDVVWRVAGALVSTLIVAAGFLSYEVFAWIRRAAVVTVYPPALINNPYGFAAALLLTVGGFARYRCINAGAERRIVNDRTIAFGVLSMVAFFPLPVQYLADGLPYGARRLYLGYVLKSLAFLHLYWTFFRYHALEDDRAFIDMWRMPWSYLRGIREGRKDGAAVPAPDETPAEETPQPEDT